MKEPHNYKHVGIGMIAVAGSLAAIGILVLVLHSQPFFSDSMMNEKIKQSEEMIKRAAEKGNTTGDKLAEPKPAAAILSVYLK
jgi:hypothetical protein